MPLLFADNKVRLYHDEAYIVTLKFQDTRSAQNIESTSNHLLLPVLKVVTLKTDSVDIK